MLVQYFVQLGEGELMSGSYDVEGDEVTVADLQHAFPYAGEFHLRWKVKERSGFVWHDAQEPTAVVPPFANGLVVVKALPLFHVAKSQDFPFDQQAYEAALQVYQSKRSTSAPMFASDPSAGFDSGKPSIPRPAKTKASRRASETPEVGEAKESQPESPSSSPQEKKKGALSFLKKGLGAIKKKGQSMTKAFSSQMQKVFSNQAKLPSEEASASLAVIREDYYTRFSGQREDHMVLLRDIWPAVQYLAKVAKTGVKDFTPTSRQWRYIGFRTENPADDASRTSILGVQALAFFTQDKQREFFSLLKDMYDLSRKYPLAVVVLQGAVMLAETLGVQLKVSDPTDSGMEGEPVYTRRPYWELFEEPNAFEQVMWGVLFLFHSRWKISGASLSEIPVLLKSAVKGAHDCLLQAPPDMVVFDENVQSLEADWQEQK